MLVRMMDTDQAASANFNQTASPKRKYVQSFYMELVKDKYREHLKALSELTNNNVRFNMAETSGLIKINVYTDEDYVRYRTFLKATNSTSILLIRKGKDR